MARITLHITENLKQSWSITGLSPLSGRPETLGSFGDCAKENEFLKGYDRHSDNFKDIG
jgi:hypothetical protein